MRRITQTNPKMPEKIELKNALPLTVALELLQRDFHADSTKNVHKSAVAKYEEVCRMYDIVPWPATSHSLEVFAAFFISACKRATGKTYLSAIRTENLVRFRSEVTETSYLRLVNQALSRNSKEFSEVYEPWTLKFIFLIFNTPELSKDQRALIDTIIVQFFAVMRPSEVINCGLEAADTVALREDTMVPVQRIRITIKKSKTDQECVGRSIVFQSDYPTWWCCPVQAAKRLIKSGRRPPTTASYRRQISELMDEAGIINRTIGRYRRLFLPHGIRKGACQSYLLGRSERDLIQQLGGWKSSETMMHYESEVRLDPKDHVALIPPLVSCQWHDDGSYTEQEKEALEAAMPAIWTHYVDDVIWFNNP